MCSLWMPKTLQDLKGEGKYFCNYMAISTAYTNNYFIEFTLTNEHFLSGAKTCWAMSCPDVLQIGRKCIAFNIRWYCEKFYRRIQEKANA